MSTSTPSLPATVTPNFLQHTLQVNYLLSFLNGAIFILAPSAIATWMGLANPTIILGLGILFVGYAAFVYYVATHPVPNPHLVLVTVISDSLAFVACLLLLLTPWVSLSTAGMWFVALFAAVVDVFALLQFMGWRRMA